MYIIVLLLQVSHELPVFKPVIHCQGWEFAHQFFEQITRFLWAKEQKSDLLVEKSKSQGVIHSRLLFCKERWEQIAPVTL